jgi:nicotinamide riboside kinase
MSPVLKIAILGAECTGKTTLLADMAAHLRARGARVSVVDEVLRQWCAAQGRTPRADEQAAIMQAQIAAVDAAKACDYLLCDTTPLVTAVYSDVLFGDHSLYPVAVAQQSDLENLATLRPATPERKAHLIAYRDADEASSYHVAFEAALLRRIVQVPAEQRVNLNEKREAQLEKDSYRVLLSN